VPEEMENHSVINIWELIDDAHRSVRPEELAPVPEESTETRAIAAVLGPGNTYYVSAEDYVALDLMYQNTRAGYEAMRRKSVASAHLVTALSVAFTVALITGLCMAYRIWGAK
jgi:hypothetical protein